LKKYQSAACIWGIFDNHSKLYSGIYNLATIPVAFIGEVI
jgi:hypothetical protein